MQTEPQIVLRSPRPKVEHETTTNSSVYNKRHKELFASCSDCRWHKGENARNYRKFGTKKARHKDHHGPSARTFNLDTVQE